MDELQELLCAARAVHFGACLLLLAGFAVRLLVAPREGRGGTADEWRGRCALLSGLAVAIGSGMTWILSSAAEMSGSGLRAALDPVLLKIVMLETQPGRVWIVRFAIAIALGALMSVPRWRYRDGVGLVIAALLAGSLAWLGHAGAAGGGSYVLIGADVLHLLAAGFWPAGLAPFALLLRRLIRDGRPGEAHHVVRRFSVMSLAAVAVLAASGFINAWFLVGSFHALCASWYGRLLIAKLGLFAIALTLGAWNLFVHKPRLESASAALESLLVKVWIEAGIGALILPIVAIMGTLPPGISGRG